VLVNQPSSVLIHIDFRVRISNWAEAVLPQVVNAIGNEVATVKDSASFVRNI